MPRPAPAAEMSPARLMVRPNEVRTGVAISPNEKAGRRMAENRKKLGGWEAAFKAEAAPAPRNHREKVRLKGEQIGINYGPNGAKQRVGGEASRYVRATIAGERAVVYTEKGYEGLDKNDHRENVIREGLRKRAEQAVNSHPKLKSEYDQLRTPKQREAYLEGVLNDPRVREAAERRLVEAEDAPDLVDTVSEKEVVLNKAKIQEEAAKKNLDQTDGQLTRVEADLKQYERDAGGAAKGNSAKKVEELTKKEPTHQAKKTSLEAQLQDKERYLDALLREKAGSINARSGAQRNQGEIDDAIKAVQTEMDSLRDGIAKEDAPLRELENLKAREAALKAEKQTLETRRQQEDLDHKKAIEDTKKAGREYQGSLNTRAGQEEDLVNSFDKVIYDAVAEVVYKDYAEIDAQYRQEYETAMAEAETEHEKIFYRELQDHWLGKEVGRGTLRRLGIGIGGYKVRPIDRGKTETAFSDLLSDGPDKLVQNMFNGQINPDTGAVYTTDKINDLMRKNPELAKKMRDTVAVEAIRHKIEVSGLTKEAVDAIYTSDWSDGVVQTALDKNKEIKGVFDQLIKEGKLNGPDIYSKFIQHMKKHPWGTAIGVGSVPLTFGLSLLPAFGIFAYGAAKQTPEEFGYEVR